MLIGSRTPLRVSFFGGGTDYPDYFARGPGAVIGMAIDKYVYASALRLSNIIDYKYRVSYSRLERIQAIGEIEHPVIRAALQYHHWSEPLDISIQADLPAASGLGSSSAFTVGFLNLIAAFKKQSMTRLDLAKAAIFLEQDLLQENVGVQDQLHAAFGGLNRFDFVDGRISITPIQISASCLDHFLDSLVLVFTGQTRFASKVLVEQIKATREQKIDQELSHLLKLVTQAVDVLEASDPDQMVNDFGAMMHDGWMTKRKLSVGVSSPEIDALYEGAIAAGAIGGKLCGAGGGGFLLMVVPPARRVIFDERMKNICLIPVGMDRQGSVILRG